MSTDGPVADYGQTKTTTNTTQPIPARTINVRGTKGPDDTKHICPLQLEVIRRCVCLYSNPGEVVFSPFAGIGSEGYVGVLEGRRYYGVELKAEYYREAERNMKRALRARRHRQGNLLGQLRGEKVSV